MLDNDKDGATRLQVEQEQPISGAVSGETDAAAAVTLQRIEPVIPGYPIYPAYPPPPYYFHNVTSSTAGALALPPPYFSSTNGSSSAPVTVITGQPSTRVSYITTTLNGSSTGFMPSGTTVVLQQREGTNDPNQQHARFIIVEQPPYDPSLLRFRSYALVASIVSLFFGPICLSIPAIVCASRRPPHANRSTYRTAVILAALAIIIGIIWIVSVVIRASTDYRCVSSINSHSYYLSC